MERAKLIDLTRRFTAAFNRNDLDTVMAFFADDSVYIEKYLERPFSCVISCFP